MLIKNSFGVLYKTTTKYPVLASRSNTITFFTPTYNRAAFLPRLYRCLQNQTSTNFVWIIVNDGSKDNTNEVVGVFIAKDELPILYITKTNGGKHSAFKVALEQCKTEFFQCMDDDDIYDEKSVEFYLKEWAIIKKENRKDIGAIRTIARRPDGTFSVDKPNNINLGAVEDLSTLEMTFIRKIHQENWTCYRTEALRDIDLFPKDYWLSEKHTFFLEAIWQGRFARKYKCRYIYKSLREYTDDAETSLIRSNKSEKHYLNMFINTKMVLDEQLDYIAKNPLSLLRSIMMVQFLRGYLNIPLKDLVKNTISIALKTGYVVTGWASLLGRKVIKSHMRR